MNYKTIFHATSLAVMAALSTSNVTLAASKQLAIPADEIDRTVTRAMQAFQVPGIAVGIVKDGNLIFAKGYGVREIGKSARVDPDTLFQIGSNTKAFTSAALALLVDEGKLHWDDRVIDYLPQFRMSDPFVTREFTIRDLLTHRSGLGLGAGDLMFFPSTDFTRDQIIQGLRFLKPASSFRSSFAYDNLLYMVAGQIIPAVTGKSWEDFVAERILAPLHMTSCSASDGLLTNRSNLAAPHVVYGGSVKSVPVLRMEAISPAGGINCSVRGMAEWLKTQLAAGTMPSGQTLFTPARSKEMWSVVTPMPVDPVLSTMYNSHISGYGLGWFLTDAHGRERVSHTGGVLGTVTWVSMIPELKLGVLVFTNQQNSGAMEAVGGQILDAYLGVPHRDWVALAKKVMDDREDTASGVEKAAEQVVAAAGPAPLSLDSYAGTYSDTWRGEAVVERHGDKLSLRFGHTKMLEGPLVHYSGNIFIVRWNERSLDADAYVRFEQGFGEQIVGMTLQAVSPATDFSFDFQDLDFRKLQSSTATASR